MIICKNCATPNPDNSKICTFCGATIEPTPDMYYNGQYDTPAAQNTYPGGYPQNGNYGNAPQQQSGGYNTPPGQPGSSFGTAGGQYNGYYSSYDQGYGNAPYSPSGYSGYQPSASAPAAAKNNSEQKWAALFRTIGFAVIAIGIIAIIAMVMTGYYKPDGSGSFSLFDSNSGDTSEVWYSNVANKASVIADDDYIYSINDSYDGYHVQKSDNSNNSTTLSTYSGYVSCLNKYKDRLYYIASIGGKNCICSVKTDSTDEKVESKSQNPDYLYIYGSHAYYTISDYSSEGTSALFRKDLDTGDVSSIGVIENAEIETVVEYSGNVYICYYDIDDYIGHIKMTNAASPSALKDLSPIGGSDEDIQTITAADGLIYFTNIPLSDDTYQLYSMNPDGTNVRKIADKGGMYLTVYGSYIYYLELQGYSGNYTTELRRVNKNGSGDKSISTKKMIFPGIINDILYFTSEDGTHETMPLN